MDYLLKGYRGDVGVADQARVRHHCMKLTTTGFKEAPTLQFLVGRVCLTKEKSTKRRGCEHVRHFIITRK